MSRTEMGPLHTITACLHTNSTSCGSMKQKRVNPSSLLKCKRIHHFSLHQAAFLRNDIFYIFWWSFFDLSLSWEAGRTLPTIVNELIYGSRDSVKPPGWTPWEFIHRCQPRAAGRRLQSPERGGHPGDEELFIDVPSALSGGNLINEEPRGEEHANGQ